MYKSRSWCNYTLISTICFIFTAIGSYDQAAWGRQRSRFQAMGKTLMNKPMPDLIVRNLSTSKTSLKPGDIISLRCQVRNIGKANLPFRTSIGYYYSTSATFSRSNSAFLGYMDVPQVPVGSPYPSSVTVKVGSYLKTGVGYIHAEVDGPSPGFIPESNENNNVQSLKITAVSGDYDLSISEFSTTKTNLKPGESITFALRLYNSGKDKVTSNFQARLYYSSDTKLDRKTDILLPNQLRLNGIDGNSHYPKTRKLGIPSRIPLNVKNGAAYIIAAVDDPNSVTESNESNNTSAIKINIGSDPDLEVSTLTSQKTATAGQEIELTYQISNNGVSSSASAKLRFYLSSDALIDTKDTPLGQDIMVPAVPPNRRYPKTPSKVKFQLPKSLVNGKQYFIGAYIDYDNKIKENSETNNTRSAPLTISSGGTELPNLYFRSFYLSGRYAAPGKPVQLNYQISNSRAKKSSAFKVRFYLSSKRIYDSSATSLGTELKIQGLSQNENYPGLAKGSTKFTLPTTLTGKQIYLLGVIDGSNQVLEANENDNVGSGLLTFTKTTDLALTSLAVVRNVVKAGERGEASIVVENKGLIASSICYVRLYLSTSAQLTGNSVGVLGAGWLISPLQPGQSRRIKYFFTAPNNAPLGKIYLHSVLDGDYRVPDSDRSNNLRTARIDIKKADVDLVFTDFSMSRTSLGVNASFTITYAVKNRGKDNISSSFLLRFYYSKRSTFDISKATPLRSMDIFIQSLGGQQSYPPTGTSSLTSKLPSTISTGTGYIFAFIDSSAQVTESDENNNVRNIRVTLSRKPDLYFSTFRFSTAGPISAGSSVTLTFQVRNGGVKAGAFRVRFYYANSKPIEAKDTYLGKEINIPGLGEGQSFPTNKPQEVTVRLPNNIVNGTRYLGALVDDNNQIDEGNEANNEANGQFVAKNGLNLPDLKAWILQTPAKASAGSTITVSFRIYNSGTATAAASTTRFYLSKDKVWDPSDRRLGNDLSQPSIPIGRASQIVRSSLTIPSGILNGNYYLLVVADAKRQIKESVEKNNTASRFIVVTPTPAADLTAGQLKITPTPALAGKNISITLTVNNVGTLPAKNVELQFYYSKDTNITRTDTPLGTLQRISSIKGDGGRATLMNVQVSLPRTLPKGSAYIGVIVDPNNKIAESKTSNNVMHTAINVLVDKDEDGVYSDKDCDDNDKAVYPGAKELCDGKDNNCDNKIDEGLTKKCYSGPKGTQGVGLCAEGTQTCTAGKWDKCQGDTTPKPETCDKQDNDCNGKVDDDPSCAPSCAKLQCSSDEFCRNGRCVPVCNCLNCPQGEICVDGRCSEDKCATSQCDKDKICDPSSGQCVVDPCQRINCPQGTICNAGQCTRAVCSEVAEEALSDGGIEAPERDASTTETKDAATTPERIATDRDRAAPDQEPTPGGCCSVQQRSPLNLPLVVLLLGFLGTLRRRR